MITYFLPIIIWIGISTSISDIKEGKIRNKYILAGILMGLAVYLSLWATGSITTGYFIKSLLYTFFALLIGVALWLTGHWNPGDAKLYTTFTLLVPPTAYLNTTTPFPPIEILFNTLMPLFIYLLAKVLVTTTWRQKWNLVKDSVSPKNLAISLLSIFSISWLAHHLFAYLNIVPDFILMLIFIYMGHMIIQFIFKEQTIYLLLLIGIFRAFFNKGHILTVSFWTTFMMLTGGFILLMMIVRGLAEHYTREINIYDLKAGMKPTEAISRWGTKLPLQQADRSDCIVHTGRELLSRKQVKAIQSLHRQGRMHFNTVKIQQAASFAPFLLLGTLLTLISQGNVLMLIRTALI